jgi:predicted aspartyl protease
MADWIGSFDADGSPRITLIATVQGTKPVTCEALLDTCFTGFLSIPISLLQGIPVIAEDMKMLKLADGSRIVRLQSVAEVTIENTTIKDNAYLDPEGDEVLLGMTFLELARRALLVFPEKKQVLLMDKLTHP